MLKELEPVFRMLRVNVDELLHIETKYEKVSYNEFGEIDLLLKNVASNLEKLMSSECLYSEVTIKVSLLLMNKYADDIVNILKATANHYTVKICPDNVTEKYLVISNMDEDTTESLIKRFIGIEIDERKGILNVTVKHSGFVDDTYIRKINMLRQLFSSKVKIKKENSNEDLYIPMLILDITKDVQVSITVEHVDLKINKKLAVLIKQFSKKLLHK